MQEELEDAKSVDVEGGLRSRVLLENHFLPACARQAAAQAVCGACGSLGLTCTVAEQAKGRQDRFVESGTCPRATDPQHNAFALATDSRQKLSCDPAALRGAGGSLVFASSAHGQCLCKALLIFSPRTVFVQSPSHLGRQMWGLAQAECFGGAAPH